MSQPDFKTKTVKGFVWPYEDIHCAAVVFQTLADLDIAIGHCKERRTAIQAGGNCGVWPTHLAKHFTDVVTFEPDPVNYACLRQNVPPNVLALNAALGDRVARVNLSRLDHNCGAHFVDGYGEISMVRLDDQNINTVDLIALDIEGYELLALRGAQLLIEQYHPVIMIEDKGLSLKYGFRQGAVVDWLCREFGYEVVERVNRDVVLK